MRNSNVVCHVLPYSIAGRSDVRPHDILVSVNGKSIKPTTCVVKYKNNSDMLSLQSQEALLPSNRPLKATFLRSDHAEKRLAIQQRIITVGLGLVSAQKLSLD